MARRHANPVAVAFTRLTDDQEALLLTLVDARKEGVIPSDSFNLIPVLTGKLWLWGSSPRVDFEGSAPALDSIAKLCYLDGGLTPNRNWRGSFTRKGFDYARWRRMNPVLRTATDRIPAAWKVTSAVVGVGVKLKDALPF